MIKKPLRIVLSNDDGIHAPGLKVLENIANQLSDDVWVVAPEAEQSGAAHSITLDRPLRIRKISQRRYCVDGTPTDCMALGLMKIMADIKPDLMLSGVNHGSNLGEDVTYSGTVAAAMEATLLDVPSIALSQCTDGSEFIKWNTAEHFAPDLIRKLMSIGWPKDVLINLNFPNVTKEEVTGIKVVKHGLREGSGDITEWHDPKGKPFYWLLSALRFNHTDDEDTDLIAIRDGHITITPLHLDLTHYKTLEMLKKHF